MKLGDKIDLDHQPVEIWIKGDEEKQKENRREKREKGGVDKGDEEGREEFREKVGKVELDTIRIGKKEKRNEEEDKGS